MSEKMFPDQNEIIVCGSCGKDVIAKRWNTHACDVGPDATNPPKEVAGEGPYHLGAWYNAEEGTEEETIEGPGFPKGIDSFELTNEILNIAYAHGLAAKEAEFEKINVRLMKAEAELAKATDRVADFVDDKAKFKGKPTPGQIGWEDEDVVGILREDVAKDSDILFRELLPEVQDALNGRKA